jgi:hypothetical protein
MSVPTNDDLLAALSSPGADFEAAILPIVEPSSSESWSHVSSGTSSVTGGGVKVFKVFATNADGCQTLCQHTIGKDAGRVCLAPVLPNAETCGTRHQ